MKISSKPVMIILFFLIGAFSIWYIASEEPPAQQTSLVAPINVNVSKANLQVASEPVDKVKSYNDLDEENKETQKRMHELESTDKSLSLSTVNKFIVNPEEKKIADLKARQESDPSAIKPVYYGSAATATKSSQDSDISSARLPQSYNSDPEPKVKKPVNPKKPKREVNDVGSVVKSDAGTEPSSNGGSYFNSSISSASEAVVIQKGNVNSNTVKAQVYGDAKVKQGGLIRFRTTEEFIYDGQTFPRNTIVYGTTAFGNDRLLVKVTKIAHKRGFVPLKMSLHDLDLEEGIYAPINTTKAAAVDEVSDGAEDIISMSTSQAVIGKGISGIVRTINNGEQKIAVSDGFEVIFVIQ